MLGIILFIVIFIGFVLLSPKVKICSSFKGFMFAGFAAALSIIAYHAAPMYDLSRHFEFMQLIQDSGKSYIELIQEPVPGYEHNQFYFLFEFFCYIAAKIGNYHLAPAFMVLTDYLIFGYITIDWSKSHRVNFNIYFITILLSSLFMPFLYAVSGMRNATAGCLAALGIYLYLEKNKAVIIFTVLMLAATLIHPVVLMALPFVILAKRKLTWKMVLLVIVIIANLKNIANLLANSSSSFLRMLGNYYRVYSSDTQYWGSRRYLYGDLLFVSIFGLLFFIHWRNRTRRQFPLHNFFFLYMIYVFGNAGNYDLVIRPMYLLAPRAGPLSYCLFEEEWNFTGRQSGLLKHFLYITLSILCLWVTKDHLTIFITEFF